MKGLRSAVDVRKARVENALRASVVLISVLPMLVEVSGCAGRAGRRGDPVPAWQSEDFVRPVPPAAAMTGAVMPSNPAPASASIVAPVTNRPVKVSFSSPFTETWVPLARWCKAAGIPGPDCLAATPLPAYSVQTGSGEFAFRAGSQVAHWGGVELRLGFAPVCIDRQPYLHILDLKKTVEPLMQGAGFSFSNSSPVLVLDPGHGGEDSGARSTFESAWEKQFTLDWARRVQALLCTNGWQVLLTRSNDCELALSNRVAFAEHHRADLFVSLHFNSAAGDRLQAGLETYCLSPTGMPSTITRGYADDLAASFPNNGFDLQNVRLALRVHRSLLEINGHLDRGVRRARFLGVLRAQQRPAILIEGGYLSNPLEARKISDPAYRQKLAEAIAGALALEPRSPEI